MPGGVTFDAAGWQHPLTDGLGSVRSVVDASQTVLETRRYTPYGMLDASTGTPQTDFGFTGEWTDPNDLLYLRARYYAPGTGVFTALDPFEGSTGRPMSLNGYLWVEGNTPNATDPTGMDISLANRLNSGLCSSVPGTTLFGFCEARCDYLRPENIWQGWEAFNSCVDRCSLGLISAGGTNANCLMSYYTRPQNVGRSQATAIPNQYLLFSGSFPGRITQPGPLPQNQMPAWHSRITSIGGQAFQYTGSKTGHANIALQGGVSGDVAVIGYSSGADSAVIFANQYQNSGVGRVTDLVILGGTMSGTMPNQTNLGDSWMCILIDLLDSGTDIYVLDDAGQNSDDPEWATFNSYVKLNDGRTVGEYQYVLDSRPHFDARQGIGTNNDPELVNNVLSWITSR